MFPLHTTALSRAEGAWELLSQPTQLELCLLLLEQSLVPVPIPAELPGSHRIHGMGVACKNLLPRMFYFSQVLWEEAIAFNHQNAQWKKIRLFFLLSNTSREVFSTRQFGNPAWLLCKSPQSIKQHQDKVSHCDK